MTHSILAIKFSRPFEFLKVTVLASIFISMHVCNYRMYYTVLVLEEKCVT